MENIKAIKYIADNGFHSREVGKDGVTAIRLEVPKSETDSVRYEQDFIDHRGKESNGHGCTYCGSAWSYIDMAGAEHPTQYYLYLTQGDDYKFLHVGATYDADCPACLRQIKHSINEHGENLRRNYEASSAEYEREI